MSTGCPLMNTLTGGVAIVRPHRHYRVEAFLHVGRITLGHAATLTFFRGSAVALTNLRLRIKLMGAALFAE